MEIKEISYFNFFPEKKLSQRNISQNTVATVNYWKGFYYIKNEYRNASIKRHPFLGDFSINAPLE